jgi:hypothetical protein
MLLHLWKNLQLFHNALAEPNLYRMYSTIVTEGIQAYLHFDCRERKKQTNRRRRRNRYALLLHL